MFSALIAVVEKGKQQTNEKMVKHKGIQWIMSEAKFVQN
jgi:hypothetical protein